MCTRTRFLFDSNTIRAEFFFIVSLKLSARLRRVIAELCYVPAAAERLFTSRRRAHRKHYLSLRLGCQEPCSRGDLHATLSILLHLCSYLQFQANESPGI